VTGTAAQARHDATCTTRERDTPHAQVVLECGVASVASTAEGSAYVLAGVGRVSVGRVRG
jgi:hypothetical protein